MIGKSSAEVKHLHLFTVLPLCPPCPPPAPLDGLKTENAVLRMLGDTRYCQGISDTDIGIRATLPKTLRISGNDVDHENGRFKYGGRCEAPKKNCAKKVKHTKSREEKLSLTGIVC